MPTLAVTDLTRTLGESTVYSGITFTVAKGEFLFIRGPSGVGKSLLLRSIAYLDQFQGGSLSLDGKSPLQLGIPRWRSLVTYVHQTRVPLKGTPSDLFEAAEGLSTRRQGHPTGDLLELFPRLGLEPRHATQPWAQLSGGQAQRAYIAVCVALQPDVLLLDEPTSACDAGSTLKVEEVLKACGASLLWVTHDEEQPKRVGGRALALPGGTLGTV